MESMGDILKRILANRQPGCAGTTTTVEIVCPRCRDTGWVSPPVHMGHPDFGQLFPCRSCNTPKIPDGPTFEGFKIDPEYPDLQKAHDAAVAWANGEGRPLLVLSGIAGVGKTHLARAAFRQVLAGGGWARWVKDGTVIDSIMAAFETHTVPAVMADFAKVSWLLIDELGLSPLSDTLRAFYDRIVDARWDGADEGRRTLFTTNIGGGDMTPRMASRLADVRRGLVVVIDAPDYRGKL